MTGSRVRLPLLATVLVASLIVIRVALVWGQLPETMASHFGPSGRPDAFTERGGFFALLGGVFALVVGILLGSHKLIHWAPALVNIPNREYWLAPERRAQAAGKLQVFMTWLALAMVLLLAGVLELTITANLERSNLDNQTMMVLLGGFFVVIIAMTIGLYRSFRVPRG